MAYPGLYIFAFSKPGIRRKAFCCTSSGSEVENPFTYISTVLKPSGSTNIWCLSLSAKRLILSSMDGQYLGPNPLILPVNIGDFSNPVLRISWTLSLVYVIQQHLCSVGISTSV